MDKRNQPDNIEENHVVTLDYTLTVDGKVIDTSANTEPIQFIQGTGQVVPGLEEALYGLQVGESKEVVVSPENGFGVEDPDAIADVPLDEFPDNFPLESGVELQLTNQDGDELEAYIVSVGKKTVRLNFNHPLAGKELHFSIKVAGLRLATEEELDHGHVHELDHDHS
ncbi:MAG: peptidylprolyl isomerase [Anaerolineales bacterium]|jgi:FKBP-type peptidyl-prolyl cis-trans isomerase SlyD